jgi:hypothetical protein
MSLFVMFVMLLKLKSFVEGIEDIEDIEDIKYFRILGFTKPSLYKIKKNQNNLSKCINRYVNIFTFHRKCNPIASGILFSCEASISTRPNI